jgi:uncharacterized Zn finger protein
VTNEQMSQDEIDTLLKDINAGVTDVNTRVPSCDDKNECNAVKTAMERLQFAQENGMNAAETAYRSWQLKTAAHALWLKRHGYTRREWQSKIREYFEQHPEHYRFLLWKRNCMNDIRGRENEC